MTAKLTLTKDEISNLILEGLKSQEIITKGVVSFDLKIVETGYGIDESQQTVFSGASVDIEVITGKY